MKRKLFLFVAMLLGLNAMAQGIGDQIKYGGGTYNVVSNNLFINGSFDDGVSGWKTIDYTTDAVESNFTITTEGGWDGGAYITTSAAGAGAETTIRQSVAVEIGKTYYFCVYTSGKAPAANNFNYNALFKMKDFKTEDGVLKAFNWPQGADQTTTDWNKTEFLFQADEAHPYVGVRMGWNSQSSFDGFVIVEVEESGIDISALTDAIAEAKEELANYEAGSEGYTILAAGITAAENAKPKTVEELNAAIEALAAARAAAKKTLWAVLESGNYGFQNVGAKNAEVNSFMGSGNAWGTQGSLLGYATFTGVTQLENGKYELDLHAHNNQNASARLATNLYADGGLPGSDAVALMIYPKGEGTYVLTFDNVNYIGFGYDGANTVLVNITDPEDVNALWTITSEAEILAQIAAMKEGDDPIEITGMIKDPGFNRHNYDTYAKQSWTETHSGGDFKLSAGEDANNKAGSGGNWNMQQWNGTFDLYQTLNVPNGKYKMSVQGFYRDGNADEAADRYSGGVEEIRAYIYANDKEQKLISIFSEAKMEEDAANGFTTAAGGYFIANSQTDAGYAFKAGYYVNEMEDILVTNGTIKIGAKNPENGANDWTVLKNFRLWYAGPLSNLGDLALDEAINNLTPYVENWGEDNYIFSEASKDAANKLLTEGEATKGQPEDVCLAKAAELNTMVEKIKDEIQKYNELKKLIDVIDADAEKFGDFEAISEKLEELSETYGEAYEDKTASVEQIVTWTTGYKTVLAGLVKGAMKDASTEKPLDITSLYDNMDGSSTADWTCTSTAFKSNFGNSEVWQANFDCSRTFADMPKGAYTISVKAFQRKGNSEQTMTATDEDITTFVYAGSSQVKVKNLSEAWSETEIKSYTEVNGGWLPNSQEAAGVCFTNFPEMFLVDVITNISEETGDLTIGIKNEHAESNDWSVWSDWHILYKGISTDALYEEVLALKAQAEKTIDVTSDVQNSNEAFNRVGDAIDAADAVSESSSEAELTAVINQLNEAISYFNHGLELVDKINVIFDEIRELTDEQPTGKLAELYTQIKKIIDDEFQYTNNAEMEKIIAEYPAARVAYIVGDISDASIENPKDITGVIVNPKFNTEDVAKASGNVNGWVSVNMGYQNNKDYQAWDPATEEHVTDEDGNPVWGFQGFAQNWTASNTEPIADSDIHQTIQGLPTGFYTLTAYCIATSPSADITVSGCELYAENANHYGVEVADLYGTPGDPRLHTVVFYHTEGQDLTIGYGFKQGFVKWFGVDNFKLYYTGMEDPTGINDIESEDVIINNNNANNAIYNLNGQKISTLRKGLNIINGKIVMY